MPPSVEFEPDKAQAEVDTNVLFDRRIPLTAFVLEQNIPLPRRSHRYTFSADSLDSHPPRRRLDLASPPNLNKRSGAKRSRGDLSRPHSGIHQASIPGTRAEETRQLLINRTGHQAGSEEPMDESDIIRHLPPRDQAGTLAASDIMTMVSTERKSATGTEPKPRGTKRARTNHSDQATATNKDTQRSNSQEQPLADPVIRIQVQNKVFELQRSRLRHHSTWFSHKLGQDPSLNCIALTTVPAVDFGNLVGLLNKPL